MKYGDTLHQRSVPEWGPYNIDYNEIKQLIKARTTNGPEIAIPGLDHEGRALQEFEDELFQELREQYDRIDLFVQSKSGEITRRLDHLQRQVSSLEKRALIPGETRISVKRIERFSKLEEDALKAIEDIQALARFVEAQKLAFRKLLKKYKRWTGSPALSHRFRDISNRPGSFSEKDFAPLLMQWSDVLLAVRAPFYAGLIWESHSGHNGQRKGLKSSKIPEREVGISAGTDMRAAELHSICETGSDIEVDTALAVTPLGHVAGRAVYWIHHDNLVELQVLLIQFSRLRTKRNQVTFSRTSSSSRLFRQGSIDERDSWPSYSPENEINVILCDDLQRFARTQSSSTVDDSESAPGFAAGKAAVSLRYSPDGDATVVLKPGKGKSVSSNGGVSDVAYELKLKQKNLRQVFLNTSLSSRPQAKSMQFVPDSSPKKGSSEGLQTQQTIRQWLFDHPKTQPLIHLRSRRTRFVGLKNNASQGIWALLDADILMMQSSPEDMDNSIGSQQIDGSQSEAFPYAVLEIRWEGGSEPSLVKALDESHLTERVRGFSLETHAVFTLFGQQSMPPPFWLPVLERDIRKLPTNKQANHRRSSIKQITPESTNTHNTSTSATSMADGPSGSGFSAPFDSPATSVPDQLESPPLKAFKKRRRLRKEHPLGTQTTELNDRDQHYWNEFDDGDEANEDKAYILYVSPESSSLFPGSTALLKFGSLIANGAKRSTENITRFFRPQALGIITETRPLMCDSSSHIESELGDDSSTEDVIPRTRHYSTFQGSRKFTTSHRYRDTLLLRCCISCFILSFVLATVSAVLVTAGRRKVINVIRFGVVVCVVFSILSVIIGVGLTVGRRRSLGWVHQTAAMLILAIICVGDATILVILSDR